jgi:hypothetical protein
MTFRERHCELRDLLDHGHVTSPPRGLGMGMGMWYGYVCLDGWMYIWMYVGGTSEI